MKEESGIDLDPESMRYLGSQPWPYPASLMLGYRVQALTCEIAHDEQEMAQVQWFTREEFEADCASGALRLPGKSTIAWALIRDWYGADLPDEWSRR